MRIESAGPSNGDATPAIGFLLGRIYFGPASCELDREDTPGSPRGPRQEPSIGRRHLPAAQPRGLNLSVLDTNYRGCWRVSRGWEMSCWRYQTVCMASVARRVASTLPSRGVACSSIWPAPETVSILDASCVEVWTCSCPKYALMHSLRCVSLPGPWNLGCNAADRSRAVTQISAYPCEFAGKPVVSHRNIPCRSHQLTF